MAPVRHNMPYTSAEMPHVMRSTADTVEAYLAALPEDRREAIDAVRAVILQHLPDGYRESINWGMISYEIPLERYPNTYNKQPLGYAALASQKNYCALYLVGAYADDEQRKALEAAFEAAGKKMDMGKSCLRFRRADDLPLDAIGAIIAATPPDAYIAQYEASRKHG